jgi:drug/metabolite transporter, DME family
MVVRGMLAVLLTAVLWGTTGTAAAQTTAGPLAIGAVAMGVGGLLQAAVSGWWPHRAGLRARPGVVAVGAVSVAVYPLAFYSSMHLAGVAVGTVVSIGSAPLIAAVLERRFTVRWGIGATLGVLGVALLSAGHGAAGGSVPGILLGLLAGLTYAVYSWAAATLMSGGVPSRAAMGAVFGLGGVLLVPVMIVTAPALLTAPHGPAVAAYLALVPMFGGYLLFGWGLARVPVSTAITLTLLEPAVAALLAVLVVGEHLGALGWVGVGLVGGCLVVLTAPVPWRGDPVRRRLAAARRRA